MAVQIKKADNNQRVSIIYLEGRLDAHLSSVIEDEINTHIDEGNIKLLIHLGKVEYLSSSGIRIFVAISRRLHEMNGTLKFCNMSDQIKKIFKIVGLLKSLEVFPSEDEALKSF